jgi:hypothetical protein
MFAAASVSPVEASRTVPVSDAVAGKAVAATEKATRERRSRRMG